MYRFYLGNCYLGEIVHLTRCFKGEIAVEFQGYGNGFVMSTSLS